MPSLLANVPDGIVSGRVTAYVTSFVADGGTACGPLTVTATLGSPAHTAGPKTNQLTPHAN